jgi:gas vesicle protein
MTPDTTTTTTAHRFATGLLCGVAVGAALGLLFAPKPGRELRHDLGDSARRLGHQSAETYEGAKRAVTSVVNAGREAVHKVRGDGQAARA